MELWKDINGYNGYYQISNKGNVRSWCNNKWGKTESPKIKKAHKRNGYYSVSLCKDGKCKPYYIHRLVAKHFISNDKNKQCINHIDGDKDNNNADNLEWCSRDQNNKHAARNHLTSCGTRNRHSKLKEDQVIQIRSIYNRGYFKIHEIADGYEVSRNTIWRVVNRRTWKHI